MPIVSGKITTRYLMQKTNIEKGERKIKSTEQYIALLQAKIETTTDPWFKLTIKSKKKHSEFTVEEDCLMLCLTYTHGYGNWDKIKAEIAKCWAFRFDWFLLSRSTVEIQRHCDHLLRQIEREFEKSNYDHTKHTRPQLPPSRPLVHNPIMTLPPEEDLLKKEEKKQSDEGTTQTNGNAETKDEEEKQILPQKKVKPMQSEKGETEPEKIEKQPEKIEKQLEKGHKIENKQKRESESEEEKPETLVQKKETVKGTKNENKRKRDNEEKPLPSKRQKNITNPIH